MLPYPISNSQPIADVMPHLPEDIRTADSEVIVLVQTEHQKVKEATKYVVNEEYSVEKVGSPDTVSTPMYMPGRSLGALKESLKSESESGIGWFFIATGAGGGGGVGFNTSSSEREILRRFCIVAGDGRSVSFVPQGSGEFAGFLTSQERLYVNRRDAIIAALSQDEIQPFEHVDGPCGIKGNVDWPAIMRARTLDYIAKIPSKIPEEDAKPLAIILTNAKTEPEISGPEKSGAILQIATSYRRETSREAPLYLSFADFEALKKIMATSDPSQILPLLPKYASGRKALDYFSLEFLCAISSDGSVFWWSVEDNRLKSWNEKSANLEWVSGTQNFLDGVPEESRSHAKKFLDRAQIKIWGRSLGEALAEFKAASKATNRTEAKALVLTVHNLSGIAPIVTPHFLLTNDIPFLVAAISTLTKDELQRSVPRNNVKDISRIDNLEAITICLATGDGQLVWLQRNGQEWTDPVHSRATVKWREEIINAFQIEGKYRGEFPCALDKTTTWPSEQGPELSNFISKVHAVDE